MTKQMALLITFAREQAEAEAWIAFLNDVPMSWIAP
jgi:hypothetical protein